MSKLFRGKAIFKPLNTGRIDERVACVREWIANIFFYPTTSRNRWKTSVRSARPTVSKNTLTVCTKRSTAKKTQ